MKTIIILFSLFPLLAFSGIDATSVRSEGVVVSWNEDKVKLKSAEDQHFYVDKSKVHKAFLPLKQGRLIVVNESLDDLKKEYAKNQKEKKIKKK